jgi:hypothetical protein
MSNLSPAFNISQKYPLDNPITESTIRTTSQDGNHIVGSCAVGTVLDGSFHVKNFENLRVVDSTSIPFLPKNAGPISSVYMIAEFASEQMVAEYKGLPPSPPASNLTVAVAAAPGTGTATAAGPAGAPAPLGVVAPPPTATTPAAGSPAGTALGSTQPGEAVVPASPNAASSQCHGKCALLAASTAILTMLLGLSCSL